MYPYYTKSRTIAILEVTRISGYDVVHNSEDLDRDLQGSFYLSSMPGTFHVVDLQQRSVGIS